MRFYCPVNTWDLWVKHQSLTCSQEFRSLLHYFNVDPDVVVIHNRSLSVMYSFELPLLFLLFVSSSVRVLVLATM